MANIFIVESASGASLFTTHPNIEIGCQGSFRRHYVDPRNRNYCWKPTTMRGWRVSSQDKDTSVIGSDTFGVGESKFMYLVTSFNITIFCLILRLSLEPYVRDHVHRAYGIDKNNTKNKHLLYLITNLTVSKCCATLFYFSVCCVMRFDCSAQKNNHAL